MAGSGEFPKQDGDVSHARDMNGVALSRQVSTGVAELTSTGSLKFRFIVRDVEKDWNWYLYLWGDKLTQNQHKHSYLRFTYTLTTVGSTGGGTDTASATASHTHSVSIYGLSNGVYNCGQATTDTTVKALDSTCTINGLTLNIDGTDRTSYLTDTGTGSSDIVNERIDISALITTSGVHYIILACSAGQGNVQLILVAEGGF